MKNIFKFLFVAITAVGLTSCLEDENIEEQQYGLINLDANKIIELPTATKSNAVEIKNEQIEIQFAQVHLAAAEPASEPITVTLKPEPGKITGTTELLPETMYSLPNGLTVTIPAGSRDGYLPIRVNPSTLDPAKVYGLGFSIASVDKPGYVISGNYNSLVSTVNAKNQWDGVYSVTAGNVQRYSAPGVPTTDNLNGTMAGNADVTLTTINANTVEITGLRWFGNASGIAGIDNLRATIDPATMQVTMTALGNATLRNMANTTNKYDPAAKTLTLNFEWNPTANVRQITGLVLTYEKAR